MIVTLFLVCCVPVAAAPKVLPGIDVLASHNFKGLEGKRVGLITNPTGVAASGKSTVDVLRAAPGVKLVALFAPEHGVYGSELAGNYVATTVDARTRLPVFSLYGPTRKPTPAMLKNIDVLVYDIQDIGCRSYTYISTMGLAMEAAGEAGIEFFVLDRPNPLGGNRVEGMPLDPKFRSFVGQWEIPYVYGLTPGELARMIASQKWIKARPKLTIVPMRGWRRDMLWSETGLIWVPTSPHIPDPEAAFGYVATGLLGETNWISQGVGYTLPFALFAASSFEPFGLAAELNAMQIHGVFFRPIFFKPFYGGMKDTICRGVQLHYTNPRGVNLMQIAMALLDKASEKSRGGLFARATPEKISMFDKLCGGDSLRRNLAAGKSAVAMLAEWEGYLQSYRTMREPYLIYKEGMPTKPGAAATEKNSSTGELRVSKTPAPIAPSVKSRQP